MPESKGFQLTQSYLDFAKKTAEMALRQKRVTLNGFTQDEVNYRLDLHGHNEVASEKSEPWYVQLVKTFINPFIILLGILAGVSFATDDVAGGVIVTTMVLVSTFLTFFQEYRSSLAANSLKSLVSTKATVIRRTLVSAVDHRVGGSTAAQYESKAIEVPLREMVSGDIVVLSAGDMVPADMKLLSSKDLFVAQAALTGESIPVEKESDSESNDLTQPLQAKTLVFMGSNVVSGTATAMVIKTGKETYIGSLAGQILGQRPPTSFDQGIKKFTWLMIRFMLVMVPLVFLVNGLSKGDWLEAFLFAIAVAVGLTPEMLPMIVTVNLAKGALAMSKERVIVKRLHAIQNFGAMDILCTDKTGTLTQDRVVLERYVGPLGEDEPRVLNLAYLNSFYQTGLKNLLDIAVLKRAEASSTVKIEESYEKIDEIPFDFSRRRMSVVVSEKKGGSHLLICKGALEEIFKMSSHLEINGKVVPITEELKNQSAQVARLMNEDGLRVIAVGYRKFPEAPRSFSVKDESDLTLLGFVAFLDPPKETAAQAIATLRDHGVQVKVLTGDNDIVTRKICRDVGIPAEEIVLGDEIEHLSGPELEEKVERVSVFAKLSPDQKQKIVEALRRRGHVVGFLGDGINDSPALKAADVGISVDSAVDIAKESSDIILLEKNLLVLERGVTEGRKVFGNIIKYIKMGASSNFGNVLSVLGASILLPFLPMLPVQLLVQNLLYDLSQTAIPLDHVDEEYLLKPRKWEIGDIGRFMLFMGPVSSIFDYATFALMWWVFKASTPEKAALFQSGWFVEGLLSQTLVVHMIRTRKIPFFQSMASLPLVFTTVLIMIVGLAIPFMPFASKLGMTALPMAYFPWLIGFLFAYAILAQGMKTLFIRRYGYN